MIDPILLIPILILLFYFLVMRPADRQKRRQHEEQVNALKKNDRVVTIGGIYGVVMKVQKDADKITLKVDESNNTEIDFTLGSIARVITKETKEASGELSGKK